MDPYQKVQQGERLVIHAQAWNKMLDSISVPQQTGGELAGLEPGPNIVWVKNSSAGDVPRFGVLGIGGVAIAPTAGATQELEFARRPALLGVTPTEASHADRFVVCLEPIKQNAFGRAAIGGVFACKVFVHSPQHRYAGIRDNDRTQLQSASCGLVQLLWVQATGPANAVTGATGPSGVTGSTGPTGAYKWAVGVM
jgi:hypothetical protein